MKISVTLKRIFSFAIDFILLIIIEIVLGGILNIKEFIGNYRFVLFIVVSGVPLVLIRDILFGGRSIGKVIIGLEVIDVKTHKKAPIWKLILRNITSPIWIVDAIIIFSNDSSNRIMDRVLNINVVEKK